MTCDHVYEAALHAMEVVLDGVCFRRQAKLSTCTSCKHRLIKPGDRIEFDQWIIPRLLARRQFAAESLSYIMRARGFTADLVAKRITQNTEHSVDEATVLEWVQGENLPLWIVKAMATI